LRRTLLSRSSGGWRGVEGAPPPTHPMSAGDETATGREHRVPAG
jgi:hypothetical protein